MLRGVERDRTGDEGQFQKALPVGSGRRHGANSNATGTHKRGFNGSRAAGVSGRSCCVRAEFQRTASRKAADSAIAPAAKSSPRENAHTETGVANISGCLSRPSSSAILSMASSTAYSGPNVVRCPYWKAAIYGRFSDFVLRAGRAPLASVVA